MVEHGVRDQRLVRHDGLEAVPAPDDDVARRHAGDHAGAVVHRHEIAEPDRAVEQDRETGDVVGGELLQAEPDADAERAAEDGEQREVEADLLERDQHADDDQHRLDRLRQQRAQVDVELRCAREALLDQPGDPQHQHQCERDDGKALEDRQHRDLRLADRQYQFVEDGRHLGQHADEIKRGQHPHRGADRNFAGPQPSLRGEQPAQAIGDHADHRERDQDRDRDREEERHTYVAPPGGGHDERDRQREQRKAESDHPPQAHVADLLPPAIEPAVEREREADA